MHLQPLGAGQWIIEDCPASSGDNLENLKSTDNTGLPFDTQRNDTWTLSDRYEIYTGKKTQTPNVLNAGENRDLIRALQAEDRKQRIEDAKKLLKAEDVKIDNREIKSQGQQK